MKKKCILLFIILSSLSFVYSNEKEATKMTSDKINFSFNILKNNNVGKQIITYNDSENKAPILTKGNTISFIVTGGTSLGGSVILAGLGGLSFGLYNFFINNTMAEAFIAIGAVSFACSGIFLITGIVFLVVGLCCYNKYYKESKVSLFIDSKGNKNNFGLIFKI